MSLIAQLSAALLPGERVRFDLARDGENFTLMVQPTLARAVDDIDSPSAGLRAALAMPLRVAGTAAELDAELPALLSAYGARRSDVAGKSAALESLKEAAKKGARLSAETPTPAATLPGSAAATVPVAPAPVAPASNPDSLF
ncbi:MAG: PRTRC system protein E [Sphingobacteriia bacterium]|jgi:PRTRC genetic system protein E|nr:PRTRC system protein E [Sphingobacteriia bacterium]